MLNDARMSAMTDCSAAFEVEAKVRFGPFVSIDTKGGFRSFAAGAK
ncbi:MAG: hypothetical protein ACSHWX_16175 [Maritalea sp.]